MKTALLICLALISLTACKCPEYLQETVIEYRDTLIPGATVTITLTDSIPVPGKDSIVYRKGKPYKVIQIKEDTASKAQLRILQDEYGQLLAECEAKDQALLKANRVETKTVRVPVPHIPWYIYAMLGMSVMVIVILIVKAL